MKKILLGLLLVILGLIVILLINTIRFSSDQVQFGAIPESQIPSGASDRFAEAISYRTISYENESDFDSTQFEQFNAFIKRSYPLMHTKLQHDVFNNFSHLFTWKGTNSELKPIILMGHIDVVPIAYLPAWTVHPFDEGVKNDTIYGRGTIDDKVGVVAILEAAEQLLSQGYVPERDIMLAFGHDEEVLGKYGAKIIAKHLEAEGIEAEFVLDEGSAIISDMIPNIEVPSALIGIAEKGFLSLELEVAIEGGHSSMPGKETAIDVMAKAIDKLKSNPLPAKMHPILEGFLDKLGPEMSFTSKLAIANRWLFAPVILKQYEGSNSGNANIRTTTAPTIFNAGLKENVIPTAARAVVNFRILPGDTKESVLNMVKDIVNDERITISMMNRPTNPSKISPIDNLAYSSIEKSIKEVFPEVLTAPSLVVGGTDSRYFQGVSDNIYRFLPIHLNEKNIDCFHGIDEHVPVKDYENAIRFYRRVIENIAPNQSNEVSQNSMKTLEFKIEINASPDKVYRVLLDSETYQEWTSIFEPTSHFEGDWSKGSEMRFLSNTEDGNKQGLLSIVKENIPNKKINLMHIGLVQNGEIIKSGEEVESFLGAQEIYSIEQINGLSILKVQSDSFLEMEDFFDEVWPKALNKIKELSEEI